MIWKTTREVEEALALGRPLVALESTVLAHGLPYPVNLETAAAMDAAIRAAGAVPAGIGLIRGEIRVGLGPAELEELAHGDGIRKCSPRDLAPAVAAGQSGGTTVAATMRIAHAAGIRVFATGGIGGVHRGHAHDVSADLVELGRTPMTVVCAGAKAILDLPLTLERLETEGVCVIGLETDEFPAFFCRTSGLPVDQRCDDIKQAAEIVRARDRLALPAAVLLTVPVPRNQALDPQVADGAIQAALADADEQSLHGKALTPFLLARVAELTGAASRDANVALLVNNARAAAELAVSL